MVTLRTYGWILKNQKIIQKLGKYEIRKHILKSLISSNNYPLNYKFYFIMHFYKFPKNISISKLKSFCIFSNYGRCIFRQFKMSRHSSKYLASHGFMLGLRKSSF